MSSSGKPSIGAQAAALITSMLLADASLENAAVNSVFSAAVAKSMAANGDPATTIAAFQVAALAIPLLQPGLTPQFIMQGLQTFQALQALGQAYIAAQLAAAQPNTNLAQSAQQQLAPAQASS